MTDPVVPTPAPAPAAAGPAQVLSLISFIAGIAGIVLGAIPALGFLIPLAAIILGFIGRKREPAAPKWMTTIGIVLGFVGIVLGGLWFFLEIILPLVLAGASAAAYSSY